MSILFIFKILTKVEQQHRGNLQPGPLNHHRSCPLRHGCYGQSTAGQEPNLQLLFSKTNTDGSQWQQSMLTIICLKFSALIYTILQMKTNFLQSSSVWGVGFLLEWIFPANIVFVAYKTNSPLPWSLLCYCHFFYSISKQTNQTLTLKTGFYLFSNGKLISLDFSWEPYCYTPINFTNWSFNSIGV